LPTAVCTNIVKRCSMAFSSTHPNPAPIGKRVAT
jgi:hypothetical protein